MFLCAQSTAMEIETLLNTSAVTYGQASRFILQAANIMAVNNQQEALNYAIQQKWLPANVRADDLARLDDVCLLFMKAFEIKGGMMYSMRGSPHYAYRELVYLEVVQGRTDPAMTVSGERFLFFTNRMLSRQDAQDVVASRDRRDIPPQVEPEHITAEPEIYIPPAGYQPVTATFVSVWFSQDSAVLLESERLKLQEYARILRANPNVRLLITGHAARSGTDAYLNTLSRRRAQAVADYLVSLGACRAENITITAHGASRPLANNTTVSGMAANRRVEIIILEN
ncbi:MAG: OmpA family protein [Treponema sp.]|nr:OmpA family protein [Treponema sp.]